MKKTRFTEDQIVLALKQLEAGVSMKEISRKYEVSEQTIYAWRKKYGGLAASELRELRQLRDENKRLKRVVADLVLDKQVMKDVLTKKL
jgi:putative transposase